MSGVPDRSRETINWTPNTTTNSQPQAKYGRISESLRHSLPEEKVCSMFCGGKKCKYCIPDSWKKEQLAIKGLFSAWVTDNILATSRPSTELIEKYEIIEQFKKNGINSIINLQSPGEHASCGGPLEAEGFSYSPQTFMDNDVFFYNFGWRDYSVGSLSIILDMVKVMQFAISEGKIAVHCHAGLGRTGVMIACYLVFANRMSSDHAIHYIREKRPGAIQTRSQIICIQEFCRYLIPLKVIFSSVVEGAYDFSLSQFLIRQKHILHGLEARKLKHIPKIIYIACERLLELAERGKYKEQEHDTISVIKETVPRAFNNRRDCDTPSIKSIQSYPADLERQGYQRSSLPERVRYHNSVSYDPSIKNGAGPSLASRQESNRSSNSDLSNSSSCDDLLSQNSFLFKHLRRSRGGAGHQNNLSSIVEEVARALAATQFEEPVKQAVENYKKSLNNTGNWRPLQEEKNPLVIAALMWDWIDQLKEPILKVQDLQHMLNHTDDAVAGLNCLDKGAKCTTEYLIGVIVRLSPLPEEIEMDILQRMLSTLTHQNMVLEDHGPLTSPRQGQGRRTTNHDEMHDSMAKKMLYFFSTLLNTLQNKMESLEEEQT